MTATTSERSTDAFGRQPIRHTLSVYQSTALKKGWLICKNATGYAVAGAVATTLLAVGISLHDVDNSAGASGALEVEVESGVYKFENSAAGDAITIADLYQAAYIVDNQTVAKTSGSSTRSVAGMIVGVDSDGVRVLVSPEAAQAMAAKALAGATTGMTSMEKTVTFEDLTGADTEVDFAAALPAGAVVFLAHKIITTPFSGGTLSAAKAELGVNGGDEDCIYDASDVFTGAADAYVGNGVKPNGLFDAATLAIHINGLAGDTYDHITAGEVTFRVYYCVPA